MWVGPNLRSKMIVILVLVAGAATSFNAFGFTEVFQLVRNATLKMVGCESLMNSELRRFTSMNEALSGVENLVENLRQGHRPQRVSVDLRQDFLSIDNLNRPEQAQTNLLYSRLAAIKQAFQAPDTRAHLWKVEGDQIHPILEEWIADESALEVQIKAQMAQRPFWQRWLHGRLVNIFGRHTFWNTQTKSVQSWLVQFAEQPQEFRAKIVVSSTRFILPRSYDNRLQGYANDLRSARQETIELWEKLFTTKSQEDLREVQVIHIIYVSEEGRPVWLAGYLSRPLVVRETIPSGPRRTERELQMLPDDPLLVPIPVPVRR